MWSDDFIKRMKSKFERKRPRKKYMRGKVRNYHVNNLSITFDDMFGEIWVYDFKAERPLMPGEEDVILKRVKA